MVQTPEEMLRAYVGAFETLEPDAIVPFYHLPSMFIAPQWVSVVADAGAARSLATMLVEQARGQGYRRTEILDLEVRRLAESLASLTGVFVRLGDADREIGRFGFAYTLLGDGQGWRIAVAMAHDAPPTRS